VRGFELDPSHQIVFEFQNLLLRRYEPIYVFEFADPMHLQLTEDLGFEMGVVHSSELPYQFPHFDNTSKLAALY
jgi:hypothetical protein